jgi:hypothetical protein
VETGIHDVDLQCYRLGIFAMFMREDRVMFILL